MDLTVSDVVATAVCSLLSWAGSVLVLFSYLIARTQTNSKAAQLIRNLALTDFIWFSLALLQCIFWVSSSHIPGHVPDFICFISAPLIIYVRMASLLWTCAISFDVLMSVNKRKWHWTNEFSSLAYMKRYYLLVYLVPLPGAIFVVVLDILAGEAMGCEAGYEPLESWYLTLFTELLPISFGFFLNVYVYLKVRGHMALKAYPQSVRKRRRKIMYHYIVVCILCWTPTMAFYLAEICGLHSPNFEIVSRASLYLTGFFNFLVFGMQDPHLKRSFQSVLFNIGCSCLLVVKGPAALKKTEVDKSVCFEENTISGNADISKDKKNIYRHHKLSKADKKLLYEERPDLDPSKKKKKRSRKKVPVGETSSASTPSDDSAALLAPLLQGDADAESSEGSEIDWMSSGDESSGGEGDFDGDDQDADVMPSDAANPNPDAIVVDMQFQMLDHAQDSPVTVPCSSKHSPDKWGTWTPADQPPPRSELRPLTTPLADSTTTASSMHVPIHTPSDATYDSSPDEEDEEDVQYYLASSPDRRKRGSSSGFNQSV